jgi:hypothetical protein
MFEIPRHLAPVGIINGSVRRLDACYLLQAQHLYRRALVLGWLHVAWAVLTGRSYRLLTMDELASDPTAPAAHGGLQPVSLQYIIASEGRCTDFDRTFHPLQRHTRDRWMSVAMARLAGIVLPPVDLLVVGSCYAVRDGHHRLSVARMLGEASTDALVAHTISYRHVARGAAAGAAIG